MEHYCDLPEEFPLDKFHQKGVGAGKQVLLVGESPAPNGWRRSGRACYTQDGKILPTGRRLNELLKGLGLSVEDCGFTELSKCFVGKDRRRLLTCSQKCWPIFLRQIGSCEYTLLIILGVETLRIFNLLADSNLKVGELGNVLLEGKQYSVLPIFHPSPINPTGRMKNLEIFQRLNSILGKTVSKSILSVQ